MKIRTTYIFAAATALAVAAWMATGTFVVGGRSEGTAIAASASAAAGAPVRVRVERLEAVERVPTMTARGRTEADARVEVRAETSGAIVERPARKGDLAARGNLLCRLEKASREARAAQARAGLAQAEFDLDAATRLEARGVTPEARVKALRAARDAARASLAESEWDLAKTEVRAPIDGLVQDPVAEVGNFLKSGDICVTLVDSDPMIVAISVTERDIAKLAVGMAARATLATGETANGTIRYIAPSAEPATRTFRVEVAIANPDLRLRDGVTATVAIDLPAARAHRLPASFLALDDAGTVGIKTVGADSRVVFRPVRIVAQDRDAVWVSGLPDTVDAITLGHEFVAAGAAVEPVRAGATQ